MILEISLLAGGAIVIGALVYVALEFRKNTNQAWNDLSADLGAAVEGTIRAGHSITGYFAGRPAAISEFVNPTSETRTTFTMAYNYRLPVELKLKSRFWDEAAAKALASDGIPQGHAAFDAVVVATAEDDKALRRFLTPERLSACAKFFTTNTGTATAGNIEVKMTGHVQDAAMARALLSDMARLADVLDPDS